MSHTLIASAQCSAESFRRLEEQKTPYVLIDRHFPGLSANFVGTDDEGAGRLATEHLIAAGCRRIAHIRGPDVSTAIERLRGYTQTLMRHHLDASPQYVVMEETGDEHGDVSGGEAMKRLLAVHPRLDGVFCYNDPTAMGAMQAILDAGLRIPEDIAVIGCGNVQYAQFLRVPLSSIDQSSYQIGEKSGQLALSLIASKTVPESRSILLQPRVVARASTLRQPTARVRRQTVSRKIP